MNMLKHIKCLFKQSHTVTKSQSQKMFESYKALHPEPLFEGFQDEELQNTIEENSIYNQDKVELDIIREPITIELPKKYSRPDTISVNDLSKLTIVDENGRSYAVLSNFTITRHPHLMGDYKQLSLTIIDVFDLAK